MRSFVRIFALLLIAHLVVYAACARSGVNGNPGLKPLNGTVDYSTADGGTANNSGNFQGGTSSQGRLDSNRGATSVKVRPPIPLGVERHEFLGDEDDRQLNGNADRSALQGETATRAPFPLNGERSGLDGGVSDRGPFQLNGDRSRNPGDLPERELAMLGLYDVVVIVDKSYSMGTHDCPPPTWGSSEWNPDRATRWDWCFDQIQSLTRQVSRLPNRGITVVVFDDKFHTFENVSPMELPRIFSEFRPWNGTKLVPPLSSQLEAYFSRRAMGRARPLLIAIISDGRPHDDEMICPLLVETTQQMRNPKEIAITFLQVGMDPKGEWFVDSLNRAMLSQGARYEIFKARNFRELMHTGLTRALIEAIQPSRQARQPSREGYQPYRRS